MRTTWSAFHLQFLRQCHRHSAKQWFGQIQARNPVLAAAPCIDVLLMRQHDAMDPSPDRHAVVRALAVEAQGTGPSADLAATILILALWPGLDAVRQRLWRDWPQERDDLADEILAYIAIGIRRLDLAHVGKVAATLIMNTERDIRRMFLARKILSRTELPMYDSMYETLAFSHDVDAIDFGTCRDHLLPVLGRDTDFFLRIIISGETQAEAGAAVGLTPDAARKRHQRAKARVAALQINSAHLSHSDPTIGL